jgi:ketosteroid isomerase-like protein
MNPEERRAVEIDVARIVPQFFMHLDNQAFDRLADLMAPDGTWYRAGKELRGRAMLLQAMDARGTTRRTRHLISNIIVDAVDADHAEAVFYSTAFVHTDTAADAIAPMELPSSIGTYRATFIRMPDGWRIATLKSQMAFRRQS